MLGINRLQDPENQASFTLPEWSMLQSMAYLPASNRQSQWTLDCSRGCGYYDYHEICSVLSTLALSRPHDTDADSSIVTMRRASECKGNLLMPSVS